MHTFTFLAFCLALIYHKAVSAPIATQPGTVYDVQITPQNTLNGSNITVNMLATASPAGTLRFALINNLPSSNVHAYVSGLDSNSKLVMLDRSGAWYYPNANGNTAPQALPDNIAIPLGPQNSNTSITLPDYISSARVWFADGTLQFFVVSTSNGQGLVEPSALNMKDPNADTNWGFIELTNIKNYGLFANLSFVDFVGMALGMSLRSTDNSIQEAKGIPHGGKFKVCDDLRTQAAKDGSPWDQLCVTDSNNQVIRVLSPAGYVSTNPAAFDNYWTNYTSAVANHYSSNTLTIDTQSDAGLVNCTFTSANTLTCQGDNRPYALPTASDIFGCNSGPFAIEAGDNAVHRAVVPRLCAAFNRGNFLQEGGNVQPKLTSSDYYKTETINWYSALTHKHELDGRGYAFSYDDVAPSVGDDVAGIVAGPNPDLLTVFVGGHWT